MIKIVPKARRAGFMQKTIKLITLRDNGHYAHQRSDKTHIVFNFSENFIDSGWKLEMWVGATSDTNQNLPVQPSVVGDQWTELYKR